MEDISKEALEAYVPEVDEVVVEETKSLTQKLLDKLKGGK